MKNKIIKYVIIILIGLTLINLGYKYETLDDPIYYGTLIFYFFITIISIFVKEKKPEKLPVEYEENKEG